jgi:hypothetical protein
MLLNQKKMSVTEGSNLEKAIHPQSEKSLFFIAYLMYILLDG